METKFSAKPFDGYTHRFCYIITWLKDKQRKFHVLNLYANTSSFLESFNFLTNALGQKWNVVLSLEFATSKEEDERNSEFVDYALKQIDHQERLNQFRALIGQKVAVEVTSYEAGCDFPDNNVLLEVNQDFLKFQSSDLDPAYHPDGIWQFHYDSKWHIEITSIEKGFQSPYITVKTDGDYSAESLKYQGHNKGDKTVDNR